MKYMLVAAATARLTGEKDLFVYRAPDALAVYSLAGTGQLDFVGSVPIADDGSVSVEHVNVVITTARNYRN